MHRSKKLYIFIKDTMCCLWAYMKSAQESGVACCCSVPFKQANCQIPSFGFFQAYKILIPKSNFCHIRQLIRSYHLCSPCHTNLPFCIINIANNSTVFIGFTFSPNNSIPKEVCMCLHLPLKIHFQ